MKHRLWRWKQVAAALIGCVAFALKMLRSAAVVQFAVQAVALQGSAAPSFQNPVLNVDFPDPTVLRGSDGRFWAYATQGNGHRLQVASSPDLVSWQYLGEALGAISWLGEASWAPDVTLHNGTYWMYFAGTGPDGNMCVGVATSTNPAGPFEDALGAPLVCGNAFETIDPKSFDDPATGRIYLYWGSDFAPLRVQELDATRKAFVAGSSPQPVVFPSDAPYESLIEGSWLHTRADGVYYLFYSGNNCCGPTAHYAVMVAAASSPLGPFQRLANATGAGVNGSSVILSLNTAFVAPGHNSIVTDDAGSDWIFYHAYAGAERTARMLMMDRVRYNATTDGTWPWVGTPSTGPTTGPVITPA